MTRRDFFKWAGGTLGVTVCSLVWPVAAPITNGQIETVCPHDPLLVEKWRMYEGYSQGWLDWRFCLEKDRAEEPLHGAEGTRGS